MMLLDVLFTRSSFLLASATTFQSLLVPSTPSIFSSSIINNVNDLAINSRNGNTKTSISDQLTKEEYFQMQNLGAQIVRQQTSKAIRSDPKLAGSILRLAFHDAATRDGTKLGGPNGSIQYEISDRIENRGLSKPLSLVEHIAEQVSGLDLSLADTIALAGAEAVECSGGPTIRIGLGRIDSTQPDPAKLSHPIQISTDRSKVETTLPSAGLDSDGLRLYFGRLGLSEAEWVSLCGAHDLGRHVTLLQMPKQCLKNLTRVCLEDAPVSVPFVTESPDTFSNLYFQKLLNWYDRTIEPGEVAFIPTDVALVVDEGLRKYVERYAKNEDDFFRMFTLAYQKLVDTSATTLKIF